jgi:CSLREA domain-containing protein
MPPVARITIVIAAFFLTFLWASAADAAEIKVTTRMDEFDVNESACSLREAVQAANINSDFGGCIRQGPGYSDTIMPRGGKVYERTRDGEDDNNNSGDLDILGPITIKVRGDGRATIDGNDFDRVIEVQGTLHAGRLVIQNGSSDLGEPGNDNHGGGVLVTETGRLVLRSSTVRFNEPTAGGVGGGIMSRGVADIANVAVNHNDATYGGGLSLFDGTSVVRRSTVAGNEALYAGGGLYLIGGDALITGSTISDNSSTSNSGQGGGGVYTYVGIGEASWRFINDTISGNSSALSGSGIFAHAGTPELNAVTVTKNHADFDGNNVGAGAVAGSSLYFKNSIVAGNLATDPAFADCNGGTPIGHNLVGVGTGCSTTEDTIARMDPKLKPLGDYGGPTETHALKPDSAAIGRAGKSAPAKDQRGVKRDANPDLGAFER